MIIDQFLGTVQSTITGKLQTVIGLRNKRTLKQDLSFVTEGDLLIQEAVKDVLKKFKLPFNLVSEEEPLNVNLSAEDYVVVLDPIDGTENFTSGLPEWGVSVSCFHQGRHVGSLLGCPEMNLWLKSGDSIPRFTSRIVALSSSLNKEEIVKAAQGVEYRVLGCCVYSMMSVIRGSFLSFENPKGAHSWDILGGLNLALEHRLKVTVDGKPYSGEYLPADRKYRFRVDH